MATADVDMTNNMKWTSHSMQTENTSQPCHTEAMGGGGGRRHEGTTNTGTTKNSKKNTMHEQLRSFVQYRLPMGSSATNNYWEQV